MKNKKAFTLIELLVVVAIIAILLSLVIPAVSRARNHNNQIKNSPAPVQYNINTN